MSPPSNISSLRVGIMNNRRIVNHPLVYLQDLGVGCLWSEGGVGCGGVGTTLLFALSSSRPQVR